MPEALAAVHSTLNGPLPAGAKHAFLRGAERVLALGLLDAPKAEALPSHLQALFDSYGAAKKAKDYKASDALRAELAAKGVKVKDTPQGPTWSRA